MKQKKIDDPQLQADLQDLAGEAPRNSRAAAETRAAFISEVLNLRKTVSKSQPERHKYWKRIFAPFTLRPRREGFSMTNAVLAVVMVLGLIFGGSGITVSAAQSAMPDDALYNVKLATEKVRMQLAGDAEAEFQLALLFSSRRMEEAGYMLGNGEAPDEALMNRIQEQNENCLKLAIGMPEDQVVPALIMVQEQFRQQLQLMQQLNMPEDAALDAVRLRLMTRLEEQLQLAQLGEGDQLKLKEELRIREQQRINQLENDALRNEEQNQYQNQDGSGSGGPNDSQWQGDGSGEGNSESSGEAQNPWTTGTPTPGSSYGPGDSQNPWTTGTPTPGSGYGPGDGDCTTCTPNYGTPGGSGGNQP